ncbi:MAG: PEP-CTERM sorting domain-containing protein [Thiobacillus sp.]|nr:PEP-CTERM sorting domain-containing protein [Thiobacillus sp.]
MNTLSKKACSLAVIALAFGAASAQAAQVNFTLTGSVIYADSPNLFDLVGGDTVSVTGLFDDAVLSGGTGTVSFASGSGNSFTVTAGNLTFNEADDISGGVYPTLVLNSGQFEDFNFLADIGIFGYFDSQLGYFDGDDDAFGLVSGTWTELSVTPVPEASTYAMMLAGLGLVGFMGAARRKSLLAT